MTPVEWALKYAELGYRVFPAVIFMDDDGKWVKAPRSKRRGLVVFCGQHDAASLKADGWRCRACLGGHNAATTDPDLIARYWRGRNSTSVVGLLPSEGVIIIDDDSGVFDPVWVGALPRVQTASGKSHYYFRLSQDQTGLASENQIEFTEPDGLIDTRVGDGKRYAFAPCGMKHYQRKDGWHPDPARLPLLPSYVYERLLVAPRRSSGGGTGVGGAGHAKGVPAASVGNAYDQQAGVIEELLDAAGWQNDDADRWIRPGGSRPSAVLSESDGIWFLNVFSLSDDVLKGGCYYTASMLRCLFHFGGNWTTTYLALTDEGAFNQLSKGDPK